MFKFKTKEQYWAAYSSYQTFSSKQEMYEIVRLFESTYEVSSAIKAVLNTIKLHATKFFGVCWMYRDEIARKAKVSPSSVKRAVKMLKEIGILTVHEQNHTKYGRQTHNVYVINQTFIGMEQANTDPAENPENCPALETKKDPSIPVPASDSAIMTESYKNSNKNSNKNIKDLSIKLDNSSVDEFEILKHVPNEFIDLLEPFYGHSPKIIRDRWRTVCVAVKKNCLHFENTSWETIGKAWKDTVKMLKRGRVRTITDDGIGGYFYGVLCDYLMDEYLRNNFA